MWKPNYKLETKKLGQGFTTVIGCDEAGRGCLAGPVVAGAVVLNPVQAAKARQTWYAEINDSKKLTPVKRFLLEKQLREHALSYGIGVVSPAVIDKMNIHVASLLAMKRAVEALQKKISHATYGNLCVLIDGRFNIPNLDISQEAIVGGDSLVMSIAAASILAKTYRDRLMMRLDIKLPQYGFAQHKGYGTLKHKASLQKHGPSQVHRQSFLHV